MGAMRKLEVFMEERTLELFIKFLKRQKAGIWDRWETGRKATEYHGGRRVQTASGECGPPSLREKENAGWHPDQRRLLSSCLGTLAVML